jgi:hypothetical protein
VVLLLSAAVRSNATDCLLNLKKRLDPPGLDVSWRTVAFRLQRKDGVSREQVEGF